MVFATVSGPGVVGSVNDGSPVFLASAIAERYAMALIFLVFQESEVFRLHLK